PTGEPSYQYRAWLYGTSQGKASSYRQNHSCWVSLLSLLLQLAAPRSLIGAFFLCEEVHPVNNVARPLVMVLMGSKSDWETMRHADETLQMLGVAHECRVLSAHRTPDDLAAFVRDGVENGIEVFIAGAGGAAHLAGAVAAHTTLPV